MYYLRLDMNSDNLRLLNSIVQFLTDLRNGWIKQVFTGLYLNNFITVINFNG